MSDYLVPGDYTAKYVSKLAHRCKCTYYNNRPCFNCMNGAHENCKGTCRLKDAKNLGVKLVFVCQKKRKAARASIHEL